MKKTITLLILFSLLIPSYSLAAPVTVSPFAGQQLLGNEDGALREAQFRFPSFATVGQDGVIYVSDTGNHLIRKIAGGEVTTFAGTSNERNEYGQPVGGFIDGAKKEAMFNQPQGLAVSEDGTVYVADSGNGAIRIITSTGEVSTLVDSLNHPSDIVLTNDNELFVSDTLNHRIVNITLEGEVSVVAGGSYEKEDGWLIGDLKDGQGLNAKFNEPSGLALSEDGTLYVADTANQRIRSVSPQGRVTTVAGSGDEKIEFTSYIIGGFRDGSAIDSLFNYPRGLTITKENNLYVADMLNHRLRKIDLNEGEVSTVAGLAEHGRINGHEERALLDHPTDLVKLADQSIVFVDQWNHSLRLLEWYQLPEVATKDNELNVVYQGNVVDFDVEPKIVSDRTMLPIRSVAEVLGYEVDWSEEVKTVTFTKGDEEIKLEIGSRKITKGDSLLEMDTAPYIEGERTMVPVRFVAEAFGSNVTWVAKSRSVLIRD